MAPYKISESAPRRRTNLSIAEDLVAQAKQFDINLSRAAEQGIAAAVAEVRREHWRQENKAAIEGYNAWIDRNGLPLARYRQF
ncbi:MAG TPA: type II toxin-antitoxin system CcdA family antitoxin [Stellaceae bacterium]|nr:type II toxin-antitoxin system CcdA family antitoxin [Stellaceae bacterium]